MIVHCNSYLHLIELTHFTLVGYVSQFARVKARACGFKDSLVQLELTLMAKFYECLLPILAKTAMLDL